MKWKILGAVAVVGLFVVAGAWLMPAAGEATPERPAPLTVELFPTAFHAVPVKPLDGPSVVLICIDTLRADHMCMYGYHRPTTPRIRQLSEDARVFDRAYCTAPLTGPSVVSILTGSYPNRHLVRLLWQKVTSEHITIADHLRRSGYDTAAVVSNIAVSDKASGLGNRFAHFDDRVDEPEPHRPYLLERRASRTTDAAVAWLEHQRRPDAPFLLYVHYIDPHGPYRAPDDAPIRFSHDKPQPVDRARIPDYVYEPGIDNGLDYIDRYDEEIAYTDREVGRLLDALDRLGLAKDTLIVLTADHGEHMIDGNHQYFCHGHDVHESTIRVPLVIRHPSIPPGREGQPVSIADILPTVLSVVGLPEARDIDGHSLLGDLSRRPPPYAEGRDSSGSGGLKRALVYRDRKVVVQHGMSNVPRAAWSVDALRDPGELHPLEIGAADPIYRLLDQMIRQDPQKGGRPTAYVHGENPMPLVDHTADPATRQALRSLGYLGGSAEEPAGD
jgi:arylsulfatase